MKLLRIKKAENPIEQAEVVSLERACFAQEAWTDSALQSFLETPIRHAMLLYDDDVAIGYLIVTAFDGEAEIERLGIAPQFRGHRYGRWLLLEMLNHFQIKRCLLEVSAQNIPACRLYESCGFSIFNCRPAYYHNGADAFMMEWKRNNE